MSRFVVWSDMHFHNWTGGGPILPNGISSRLAEQLDVMHQIVNYCLEHGIDTIFFCGDLFHTFDKLDSKVLNAVFWHLKDIHRSNLTWNWIPGNHDMADKQGIYNSLFWLKGVPYSYVYDLPYFNHHENWAMIPFDEDRDRLLYYIQEETLGAEILFLHQGVMGVDVGNGFVIPNEILTPEDIPSTVKMAFTGHYHNHRLVSKNLCIVGAPVQHNWGDIGQKRGWIDYNSSTGELIHVESKATKFITVKESELKDINPDEHYVRVVTNDSPDKLRVKLEKFKMFQIIRAAEAITALHTIDVPEKQFDLLNVAKQYIELNKLDKPTAQVGLDLVTDSYAAIKA